MPPAKFLKLDSMLALSVEFSTAETRWAEFNWLSSLKMAGDRKLTTGSAMVGNRPVTDDTVGMLVDWSK